MEQVLPGVDPGAMDDDPIVQAAELSAVGRSAEARTLLNRLLRMDRRCLDAHAHLGNLAFPRQPRVAFSTTDHFSAACTGTACACGGSTGSRRPRGCSAACSG
jgi:hypothetical protein